MSLNQGKKLTVLAAMAVAASSFGQMQGTAWSGNVTIDGSPYAGGNFGYNSTMQLLGTATGSSVTLAPTVTPPNAQGNRSMLRFSALGADGGTPSYILPSDREGNTSAAVAGERRVFNTWDPTIFGHTNTHSFTASVTDASETAYIDIEHVEAPRPTDHFNIGNEWTHDLLDNSIYDQDASVGAIKINKALTPVINLDYTLMSVSFHRRNTEWLNGDTDASLFRDDVFTGSWLVVENPGHFYVGFTNSSNIQTFSPGEFDTSKTVGSENTMMSWNISGLDNGVYNVKHWGIGWMEDGFDTTTGAGAFGFIHKETIEGTLTIVPEPATMTALALGTLAMLRRRKQK